MNDTDKIIRLLERIATAVEAMAGKKIRAREKPERRPDDGKRALVTEFVRCWNTTCQNKLPMANMPDPGTPRWDRIVECSSLEPDLDKWSCAFRALSSSNWHAGGNDRGWRATIDFVIQPSQRMKWLEEGAFKNSKPQQKVESRVVFCTLCPKSASVGPGTRCPDISPVPLCSDCAP